MSSASATSRLLSWVLNYRSPWLYASVLVAALFLRRPEPFLHPTFFAEDGSIFFAQAFGLGWQTLVTPYAGYLHTNLRLIALGTTALPLEWAPLLLVAASVGMAALVGALLGSRRNPLQGGLLLPLLVVLTPHTGEVWCNLTNTQWLGGLALFLVLISRDPDTKTTWAVDTGITVLLGLTGVYSILWLPFFGIRALVRRTPASWVLLALSVGAALVQVHYIRQSGTPPLPLLLTWQHCMAHLGQRTVSAFFIGPWIDRVPLESARWASVGLITTVVAVYTLARRRTPALTWTMVGVLLVCLAATAYRFRFDPEALRSFGSGDRYFFMPKILLGWILMDRLADFTGKAWLGIALVVYLLGLNFTFRMEPYRDYLWAPYAQALREGKPIKAPTNPPGYIFEYQPPPQR